MAFTLLCPECKGTGKKNIRKLADNQTTSKYIKETIPCPDCEGTGIWTPPTPKFTMRCPYCSREIDMQPSCSGIDVDPTAQNSVIKGW